MADNLTGSSRQLFPELARTDALAQMPAEAPIQAGLFRNVLASLTSSMTDYASHAFNDSLTHEESFLLHAGSRTGATTEAQDFGSTYGIKTGIINESVADAGVVIEGMTVVEDVVGADTYSRIKFPGTDGDGIVTYSKAPDVMSFYTGNVNAWNIDDFQNFSNIQGAALAGAGKGSVVIGNSTAPDGFATANCYALYATDFAAGNSCPYFRTENGTIIGLNQGLLTTDSVTHVNGTFTGTMTITGDTSISGDLDMNDNTIKELEELIFNDGTGNIILPLTGTVYIKGANEITGGDFDDVTIDAYSAFLTAYWKLDETGAANRVDDVGGHDAVPTNAPATRGGIDATACDFVAASTHKLTVPHHADLSPTTSMACSFWVYRDASTAQESLIFKGFNCWGVYVQADDDITFRIEESDGTGITHSSYRDGLDGAWHHVLVVAWGGFTRIYVNGTEGGTPKAYDNTIKVEATDLTFGVDTGGAGYLTGGIDETAFWKDIVFANPAAIDAFATALYNAGTGKFYAATYTPVTTHLNVQDNLAVGGTYTGGGLMTTGGNIVIPDGGYIGSTSDTDAIQIEADGDVVFSQDVAITSTGAVQALTFNPTTAIGDGTPVANTLYKDNIIKGWAVVHGTDAFALTDSFNVSSATDGGVGNYTVNWDVDFANNTYAFTLSGSHYHCVWGGINVAWANIGVYDGTHTAADTDPVNIIAVGDQ